MILAIDIGNTNVVLGGIEGNDILFEARMATDSIKTSDQYCAELKNILALFDVVPSMIDGTIVASVVPPVLNSFRTAIRKLKDGEGNYLLNKDATSKGGYSLFGHDVYVSQSMPDMAAGKRAVLYLDPTGLAVKVAENPSVQVLREKFADEHAVGVICWMDVDSKVENKQKIAALDMKAAVSPGG